MIILYTSPGCASCRKAKIWLKEHKLYFVEKNIFSAVLSTDEIKYLLYRCENGSDDIISTRSKVFQSLNTDINNFTFQELIDFIRDNPSVLKRPIIVDENNFVVGYDDDEITSFLPREKRKGIDINAFED